MIKSAVTVLLLLCLVCTGTHAILVRFSEYRCIDTDYDSTEEGHVRLEASNINIPSTVISLSHDKAGLLFLSVAGDRVACQPEDVLFANCQSREPCHPLRLEWLLSRGGVRP